MKDIMKDGMRSVNYPDVFNLNIFSFICRNVPKRLVCKKTGVGLIKKKLLTLINIKINRVYPVRLQSYDSLR